jgi:2-polyprenyl-3-methyl-5-hydroxy-6-metoxy-1,4-benzoquinol methylase
LEYRFTPAMSQRSHHTGAPVGLELIKERRPVYGRRIRIRQLELLRRPLGRVLDVGCAEGAGADVMRGFGATQLAGIEIDEACAAVASERYDEVVHGSVPEDLSWDDRTFDTILCYDVLEHLYDPWSALRRLARLLEPGGQIHVSIPNARHKNVWLPLVLNGTFRYARAGLLDVTHLRFFTRRDAVRMLEAAGLRLVAVDCILPGSRKRRLAAALTCGRVMEFVATQWFLLGERDV